MTPNLPENRDANWSRDEEFNSAPCTCARIRDKILQSAYRAWSSSGTSGRTSSRPSRNGISETIDRLDHCNGTKRKHDFKSCSALLSIYDSCLENTIGAEKK